MMIIVFVEHVPIYLEGDLGLERPYLQFMGLMDTIIEYFEYINNFLLAMQCRSLSPQS